MQQRTSHTHSPNGSRIVPVLADVDDFYFHNDDIFSGSELELYDLSELEDFGLDYSSSNVDAEKDPSSTESDIASPPLLDFDDEFDFELSDCTEEALPDLDPEQNQVDERGWLNIFLQAASSVTGRDVFQSGGIASSSGSISSNGWNPSQLAPQIYNLTMHMKPFVALRSHDLFASKLALLGSSPSTYEPQMLGWTEPEIQEYEAEDPPSFIWKTFPTIHWGESIISKKKTDVSGSSGLDKNFRDRFNFSTEHDLPQVLFAGRELLEGTDAFLYENIEYLFEAALAQTRRSASNLAESLALVSSCTKHVNALSHKMLASQIRYNELEDMSVASLLDVAYINKELISHNTDCGRIQEDLRNLRSHLDDVMAFFKNHLEGIFIALARSIWIDNAVEMVYLEYIAHTGDSQPDSCMSFDCYSEFSLLVELVKSQCGSTSLESVDAEMQALASVLTQLENFGSEMFATAETSQELFTRVFTV